MAETFRSGLEAIGKAQTEAGLSIGLSQMQLIRYIILLPQALAVALPGLGAGGGLSENSQALRSACRNREPPSYRASNLGFRLLRPSL